MVSRAFSVEDGDLQNKATIVQRKRLWKDIDSTFTKKPSGDIYKKEDAASVKQSVKNILLTHSYEKPFNPYFGAGLNELLFMLDDELDDDIIRENIVQAIETWEPRAEVINIRVSTPEETNSVNIEVEFGIKNTGESSSITLSLTRLR
tara:strand:- start:2264 stop:2707 length:444 start_codon:yes stop_codon:yes gene_type:complete